MNELYQNIIETAIIFVSGWILLSLVENNYKNNNSDKLQSLILLIICGTLFRLLVLICALAMIKY